MSKRTLILGLSLAFGALIPGGCARQAAPIDPGLINHVVLITLENDQEGPELEQDCERLLRPIPSVKTYACGGHYEFGRPTIKSDYTVGLLVSFDSAEGYRAYLEDPRHVELVEKWKPRWSGATIYDIENMPQHD